jgi:hypothetical protein
VTRCSASSVHEGGAFAIANMTLPVLSPEPGLRGPVISAAHLFRRGHCRRKGPLDVLQLCMQTFVELNAFSERT